MIEEIERVNSGPGKMDYTLDVSLYVELESEPVDLEEEFARLVGYERQREELGRKMEGQMGRVLERMRERGVE